MTIASENAGNSAQNGSCKRDDIFFISIWFDSYPFLCNQWTDCAEWKTRVRKKIESDTGELEEYMKEKCNS